MKKLIIGIVIGIVFTVAAFVALTRTGERAKPTNMPPDQKLKTEPLSSKTDERQTVLATNEPTQPKEELAAASLSEQLKKHQQQRQQLTPEEQSQKLEELKHTIAAESAEIDVPEVRRDADVSSARLLNKHGGKLYKFAGLILETTSHDVTVVIKDTEIVCSFADDSWKTRGLKTGGYLYACGFFESYKNEGDLKQITMANCYTIENFYKLRTTPLTEAEKQQSLTDYRADMQYKLQRDLGARKLGQ